MISLPWFSASPVTLTSTNPSMVSAAQNMKQNSAVICHRDEPLILMASIRVSSGIPEANAAKKRFKEKLHRFITDVIRFTRVQLCTCWIHMGIVTVHEHMLMHTRMTHAHTTFWQMFACVREQACVVMDQTHFTADSRLDGWSWVIFQVEECLSASSPWPLI